MLGVIMIAKAAPGRGEEVSDFLMQLATKVRGEPGNRRYDVCRYVSEPETFLVFEEYVDKAAFDAHMATPHLADAAARLPAMLAAPLDVKVYQVMAG